MCYLQGHLPLLTGLLGNESQGPAKTFLKGQRIKIKESQRIRGHVGASSVSTEHLGKILGGDAYILFLL